MIKVSHFADLSHALGALILSCFILPIQKMYDIFGMSLLPEETTF